MRSHATVEPPRARVKGAFPLGPGPGLLGIVFLAVVCALPVCAQEGALSVHTGFGFVSGDFGLDADTDIEYVPLSVTYAVDPWRFELAGSYLRVTGPSDVVVGANGVSANAANAGGSSTELRTDSGPGDLLATGSYWFQLAESTYLDVHFSTKLPLADRRPQPGHWPAGLHGPRRIERHVRELDPDDRARLPIPR